MSVPPEPVSGEVLYELGVKLEHIRACVHVWADAGMSRERAILRTVHEIEVLFCARPKCPV